MSGSHIHGVGKCKAKTKNHSECKCKKVEIIERDQVSLLKAQGEYLTLMVCDVCGLLTMKLSLARDHLEFTRHRVITMHLRITQVHDLIIPLQYR